jgi:hypothetical protein
LASTSRATLVIARRNMSAEISSTLSAGVES